MVVESKRCLRDFMVFSPQLNVVCQPPLISVRRPQRYRCKGVAGLRINPLHTFVMMTGNGARKCLMINSMIRTPHRCFAPRKSFAVVAVVALAFCLMPGAGAGGSGLTPETVVIPAGTFIVGSDAAEREVAYQLDEKAYGHSRTRDRKWYGREVGRQTASTTRYRIMVTPVTNQAYGRFLDATDHSAPNVDVVTWKGYGLIHPFHRTRRHAWKNGHIPKDREDHPVVLVSHRDAVAYATWLSTETGVTWRLPTEVEWEKAARGLEGRYFPWGDEFDAARLNSHDAGPFDTVPVKSYPQGKSPFGVYDMAGQVFEWTATPAAKGRFTVKGGSWDDKGCGVCRSAARHSRPENLKHILVGFRLVTNDVGG